MTFARHKGCDSEAMAHTTTVFGENVRWFIDEWNVPGLGIAVVQGDQIHAKVLNAAHYVLNYANGLRVMALLS